MLLEVVMNDMCEYCGKSLRVDDVVRAVVWNPSGIYMYAEGVGYTTEIHRFCSHECCDNFRKEYYENEQDL